VPRPETLPEIIRFRNAPITEAVLELRTKLPPTTNLDRLASFQDVFRDRYPLRKERRIWQGQLQMKPGTSEPEITSTGGQPNGYMFSSQDEKQVIQVRLDGFAFSRLKPYDRWSSFRNEARELWTHYRQIAEPEVITRAGLRYINRIELPLPIGDFKEYIQTVPDIAPGVPQALLDFFMRLVIPMPETQAFAVITETIERPGDPNPNILPWLFDIDVFKEASYSVNGEEVWQTLEELRIIKNSIFFNSITPKARRLFE